MTELPPRLTSALADRYRLERKLGEGGMATVYLAEDVKHERRVALKILKPELAAVIGAERFLAEIKTTANLQHPHILPLFDSGEADGFLYYVMPFIDGETLKDRIEREGQLGVEEAVRIAREVADALDYAHRNDIIHRDIKPANILLHDGRPVVSDFGIALAISAAGGGRMTETGLSLGTPHYMSPEQASADRDLSARSDVYSLGCVLYEMLAGQPPHTGPSAQSILVRILTEDPRGISELRRTVPSHVAATVMKSIEKLPADRFDTARQFMDALGDPAFTYASVVHTARTRPAARAERVGSPGSRWVRVAPWALAALLAAWALWSPRSPEPGPPTTRAALDVDGFEPLAFIPAMALSSDGQTLLTVFQQTPGSAPKLAVRRSDDADFRAVPGADTVLAAVLSPDGQWLAYSQVGRGLMKVAVQGGAPQPIVLSQSLPFVMNWGSDGTILYLDGQSSELRRVPSTGGEPETIYQGSAISARFLPGGNVLLGVMGGGVRYLDLKADSAWEVVPGGIEPRYVSDTGHLLWADDAAALWAAPFDPSSGRLTGGRGIVLENLLVSGDGWARYDVSSNGTLIYATGGSTSAGGRPAMRLATVGLDGTVEMENLEPRFLDWPRWSPDGRFVAYHGTEPGGSSANDSLQIYTYDMVVKSRPRRLTTQGFNQYPVWSPDGSTIVFASLREGTDGLDLFTKEVGSNEPPRLLLSRPGPQWPAQWLSDTQILITDGLGEDREPWIVDLPSPAGGDSARARPYFESEDAHEPAYLAPQGDLVTYSSDATGAWEVYVRGFPEPGAPEKISEGGGDVPRWSADGNSIFYLNAAGDSLFEARIDRGPPFAVLDARPVLPWRFGTRFDLHPDGDRFIATLAGEQGSATGNGAADAAAARTRYFIVTNWFDELRRRMGQGS